MSTSPIRQVFETAGPSDLVNIQRPNAGGFTAIDASVPLAALSNSRFDVTFTGLEFRSIGVTPLLLIESNRTIIITSAAIIMTEQTEAFDFTAGVNLITTDINKPQAGSTDILLTINGNGVLPVGGDASGSIGQGNAYVASKSGEDATTGNGFVRLVGTYYEIDL